MQKAPKNTTERVDDPHHMGTSSKEDRLQGGVGWAEVWDALIKPGPFYMQVPSLLTGCMWRVLSHGEAARLAGSMGTHRKSISVAFQRGKLRH